jgi:hypothetical protein
MLDQENIAQQLAQLASHRHRLAHLLEQQAKFGIYTPAYILIDIQEAQKTIYRIIADIIDVIVIVDDVGAKQVPIRSRWPCRWVWLPMLPLHTRAAHLLRPAHVGVNVGVDGDESAISMISMILLISTMASPSMASSRSTRAIHESPLHRGVTVDVVAPSLASRANAIRPYISMCSMVIDHRWSVVGGRWSVVGGRRT